MPASAPFDHTYGTPGAPPANASERVLKAHLDRRPYWVLLYRDREPLFEADPCLCGRHPIQDWMCRPKGRIRGIGMHTPDGKWYEIGGAYPDMTGLVFNLKGAVRSYAAGNSGTAYHLIGAVGSPDGHCLCYAWEYDLVSPIGGHIVGPFRDNVYGMQYGTIGALGLETLGLKL